MAKGTPSLGKHNKAIHTRCRRCGKYAYNKSKKKCSACGYPRSKLRNFNWSWKHPLKKKRKK